MSVHKKFQPNRSSRLAGYSQHIYTNVLLYYVNNFYKIKWYEEYNNFKYSSLSQSACPQFLLFLPPFACPFTALLLKECLPVCLSISSSNYNLYTFQTNFIPVLSSSYEGISSGSLLYYFHLFKLVYHSFFPLESVLYQIIPPPLKTFPPSAQKKNLQQFYIFNPSKLPI